jgi:hypothetical protein
MADVITGNYDLYPPLDPEPADLAEQILETVEVIEKEEPKTDCSQLYFWLAQEINSLGYEERNLVVVKIALKVRSQAHSIRPLEQAWDAAFGSTDC